MTETEIRRELRAAATELALCYGPTVTVEDVQAATARLEAAQEAARDARHAR